MLESNVKKILRELKKTDLVLDIGGWAMPFRRADFVADIQPYKTRGFLGWQGGSKEYFSKKTWIIHDLSSRKKLPFKNKQFDFVICSQVLEDIRDPIWLCSEIIRIGKKGYIEVPSRLVELTKGIANDKYVGYYHHRWLVDIKDKKIIFRFKPHLIHNDWKYHFPKRFIKSLFPEDKVAYLFWEDEFEFIEIIQISRDKIQEELETLIKSKGVYPGFYYRLDNIKNYFLELFQDYKKKIFPNAYRHRYMDTGEFISR